MNEMAEEKHGFQAEVGRLLDIVAHSLYSDRVGLPARADLQRLGCLRPAALSGADPARSWPPTMPQFRVIIDPDATATTLTIADNGIGMNREDLIANLGTIARSGTAAFLKEATGDTAKDLSLIGQFGVGFYAAFMVAERVEVFSRRAGETEGWRWVSEGKGEFARRAGRGRRPRHDASCCICARMPTSSSSRCASRPSSPAIPTISRCPSCSRPRARKRS